MKILITNITLVDFGGSQLYTFDLVKYLSKQGHEVVVFSPSLGPVSEEIAKLKNVVITSNLEEIKDIKFDILHIHHNVNAYLVREYFPNVPALMVIHGVLPEFEQPPQMDLGISLYIAISQEIKEHLVKNYGIPESKIKIIHNWVNKEKFKKTSEINKNPKRMLVVSNHYTEEHKKVYESVCKDRDINLVHVGLPENSVANVEDYINNSDVVVTIGRGAMESMALGRNVIISDIHGMDGMLTSDSYLESVKNNLSGRRYAKTVTRKNFETELDKYSLANGREMEKIVEEHHSREKNIEAILEEYRNIQSSKVKLNMDFVKILTELKILSRTNGQKEVALYGYRLRDKYLEEENKRYQEILMKNKQLEEENEKYQEILNTYRGSKIIKLAEKYWAIRSKIRGE